MRDNVIDLVAEVIYNHEGGVYSLDEYELCYGRIKRAWYIDSSNREDQLSEWERDDYRIQAKAVLGFLNYEMDNTEELNKSKIL